MKTDFCIIGGGVMGCATAYYLSKNPRFRVTLLDQYNVPNDYCSSNDANRVFRYAYGGDTLYTMMAVESLKLWKELEKDSGQTLLVPSGVLLLQGEDPDASKFNQDSYDTLQRLGLGAELLDEPELKKRHPRFTAKTGYFDPNGGVLLASRILSLLAQQARRQGVTIMENCKATNLDNNSHPQVETSDNKTISCEKIILTTGPWSNNLRGTKLPQINPTRQQIVYFKPKTSLERFQPPEFPVFFADQYYGIPAVGVNSVKVSHKNLWDPVDPDLANRTVDQQFVKSARNLCNSFIPELAGAEVDATKVCLYDMTKNSDFVLGPDPERPQTLFAYGFSGHGFKFAPLVGKLLSGLALDEPVPFNTGRFSPSKPHEDVISGPPY